MHFYLCFYERNIKRYTNTFKVPGASDIGQDNHELNQETTEVVHQSTSSQSNKGMKLTCRIFQFTLKYKIHVCVTGQNKL